MWETVIFLDKNHEYSDGWNTSVKKIGLSLYTDSRLQKRDDPLLAMMFLHTGVQCEVSE